MHQHQSANYDAITIPTRSYPYINQCIISHTPPCMKRHVGRRSRSRARACACASRGSCAARRTCRLPRCCCGGGGCGAGAYAYGRKGASAEKYGQVPPRGGAAGSRLAEPRASDALSLCRRLASYVGTHENGTSVSVNRLGIGNARAARRGGQSVRAQRASLFSTAQQTQVVARAPIRQNAMRRNASMLSNTTTHHTTVSDRLPMQSAKATTQQRARHRVTT